MVGISFQPKWHCGRLVHHSPHMIKGDSYYGEAGYLCNGDPGDVPVNVPEIGMTLSRRAHDAFAARVEHGLLEQLARAVESSCCEADLAERRPEYFKGLVEGMRQAAATIRRYGLHEPVQVPTDD